VVYIDPSFSENDDHPPVHPIRAQALIAAVYTALAKSPQWKNCMLVVTYDEHGGFYDHVAPPVNPSDDTLAKFGVDGFQQLGFRVPTMVAGPYAKQAHVSSVQYDHTSALKHLQNAFGLEPLNARMDAANDLTDCIDMDRLARGEWAPPAELPEINLDDWAWEDMKCKSAGGFRHADPISQWADKNPGKLGGEYDLRDADPEQRAVREFLRKHQRSR
jgi:phospholipase C